LKRRSGSVGGPAGEYRGGALIVCRRSGIIPLGKMLLHSLGTVSKGRFLPAIFVFRGNKSPVSQGFCLERQGIKSQRGLKFPFANSTQEEKSYFRKILWEIFLEKLKKAVPGNGGETGKRQKRKET
jgi:hypothetical protein